MFSIRGILVKKLKKECDGVGATLDNFNLFFYTCVFGSAAQFVVVMGCMYITSPAAASSSAMLQPIDIGALFRLEKWKLVLLLLNTLSFWGYMQFSFIVLSQGKSRTYL